DQLHRVDMPGGARRQLTFEREPVTAYDRRPGSEELVLALDQGGNEAYQLYLYDPADGTRRLLTDGTSRNDDARWSRDGRQLAFRSTRRDGAANDVWTLDPGRPAEARLLVEAGDGAAWVPGDWSADGRRLLVGQYVSSTDSRLHLLELASGELTPLAGSAERPATYLGIDPFFDAAGSGVFVATDQAGEFIELAHLDLASGALRRITAEIPWDVEDFALSLDRRRGAFVVNEDGASRLYLFDPASFGYQPLAGLPAGVASDLAFSPDGARLALALSGSRAPSDVYTVELGPEPLAATGVTRWTFSEVGGLDTARFAEPQLVRFPSFDRRSIPAFVYRPEGPGPHPVIVSIHGGPESQFRPRFSSQIQMWVGTLGVAVVAPNVRGSSGFGRSYLKLDDGMLREDSVRDIGALLDWIATQPDLDARRVAVYGGSYGGYMVLASLVRFGDRLRAGVELVGISNFVTFLENTEDYRRDLRRVEYGDERDPEMRAFLEEISPSRHVARLDTPLFVAQGQNDPRVPVSEAEQIVAAVRAAGHEVWYLNARDEGHGFDKKENRDLFQAASVLFFERQLLGHAPDVPGS
ncbi:MAG: prolyl oligopeptidase family serine peptidase, partial [Thermoanaerobaculia bacterium]